MCDDPGSTLPIDDTTRDPHRDHDHDHDLQDDRDHDLHISPFGAVVQTSSKDASRDDSGPTTGPNSSLVCVCMYVYGCVWLCMDVCGCVWMCMDVYGGVLGHYMF